MADCILDTLTNKPDETSISRDTFEKLPFEIQRGYALYHGVSEAECVTSEAICTALFTVTQWISITDIEPHLGTSTASHSFMDVMDLVDVLAGVETDEHTRAEHLPTTSSVLLWNLIGTLVEQYGRFKATMEESRRQSQEAAADTFELQAKLSKATRYHARMVTTVTYSIGAETMTQCERSIHKSYSYANRSPNQGVSESTNSAIVFTPAPAPANTTLPRRSKRHRRPPSPNGRTRLSSLPTSQIPYEGSVTKHLPSLKHSIDEVEKLPDKTPSTPPMTTIPPTKKRRLTARRDSTPADPVEDTDSSNIIKFKWDDYPSGDINDSSGSYIPSNRTESMVTDINTRRTAEMYRMEDITYASTDHDSSPETIVNGVPWNSYHIDDGSDTDGDYIPPSFDREWLREWLPGKRRRYRFNAFEEYHYTEDCIDHGLLSSSGLSTDDSEHSHYDESTLRRIRWQTCKSLGPDGYHEYASWFPQTSKPVSREMTPSYIEDRKRDTWRDLQYRLKTEPEWADCDIEVRVFKTLAPDHFVFDDQEWKFFENHSFTEPFEHRTMIP